MPPETVGRHPSQPAQLERAEGGSSAAKLSGPLRQPQDFCPAVRARTEGGSCSAANGVPMVNRLYADCTDGEPFLSQLCLIWLNVDIYVSYLCISPSILVDYKG